MSADWAPITLGVPIVLATVGWYYATNPDSPNATRRENIAHLLIIAAVILAWLS